VFDPTLTEDWIQALEGRDDRRLKRLAETEYPGTTLFQLLHFAMRLDRLTQGAGPLGEKARAIQVPRIASVRAQVRAFYGWPERRRFDLEALRELRRGNAVMPVLGAGASMAAGCPSWASLVEQLLATALDPERQRNVPVPKRGGGWYFINAGRAILFEGDDKQRAQQLLEQVRRAPQDTELLMTAAQLCADLFKEHFFSYVTPLLYLNAPAPGPVHRAVAQFAARPGSGRPGWAAVLTYNFDNLLGEALEQLGRPYSVLTVRNGQGIMSRPSSAGATEIIHVHGYVPRELMRVDGVQYVFSAAQYERLYGARDSALLNTVRRLLAKADLVALFVGCSFNDARMNQLLREAAQRRNGVPHFALLQLPPRWRGAADIPDDALASDEERYLEMGVQPIWFREFGDLPGMIEALG
jgi:hypothetical protein